MSVEAVLGGAHGRDRRPPPKPWTRQLHRVAGQAASDGDQTRGTGALVLGQARLTFDENRNPVAVQFIDDEDGHVLQEIPISDPRLHAEQGILVDFHT